MDSQQQRQYSVTILECKSGGFIIQEPNDKTGFLAARNSAPEAFFFAMERFATAMGVSPLQLLPQAQPMQYLQPPQPAPRPMPMAPPPRPMEHTAPPPLPEDPIPAGIVPDGEASRLAERIKASQRANGSLSSWVALLPLAAALVLSNLWPFGA